jgi:hypothetical protein
MSIRSLEELRLEAERRREAKLRLKLEVELEAWRRREAQRKANREMREAQRKANKKAERRREVELRRLAKGCPSEADLCNCIISVAPSRCHVPAGEHENRCAYRIAFERGRAK